MMNASFDSMFGIDQHSKILVVNEAACQAFRYKEEEEFLDKNISMICNERDAINHDKHLQRYVRERNESLESRGHSWPGGRMGPSFMSSWAYQR